MGIFDMFSSFLNPQEGYEAAEKPLQQYWDEAKGYQMPYLQRGNDQYSILQKAIGQLMDPEKLESDWASHYEESPYAKRELEINRESGLDAASSMGLMGSSAALQNIQRGAGDIVSKDRTQFMQDLMQKFISGLGLSSGIYNTGASTAANLGNQANEMGQNMSGLEYGRKNSPGNMFENLIKTGAGLVGNYWDTH